MILEWLSNRTKPFYHTEVTTRRTFSHRSTISEVPSARHVATESSSRYDLHCHNKQDDHITALYLVNLSPKSTCHYSYSFLEREDNVQNLCSSSWKQARSHSVCSVSLHVYDLDAACTMSNFLLLSSLTLCFRASSHSCSVETCHRALTCESGNCIVATF